MLPFRLQAAYSSAAAAAVSAAGGRRGLSGLAAAATVAASVVLLGRLVSNWRQRRRVRAAIAAKREARQRAKAEFAAYLAGAGQQMSDQEEAGIAALTPRQLVERLRAGQLRPERVLLAYQRLAFRADQRLNCVAEFLTPDLSEVNLAGPLAGLPVSVKENFSLKGLDSCIGCAIYVGQPSHEDCLAVTQLKALGGVPFVRTIVPQTMTSILSANPIDGTVRNPVDPSRCPGGSSSGEGALIGAGGSPLGLGSDIGGSIRVPACWCGIAGFKPTSGRLTRLGMRISGSQRLIDSSWGPMGPDVDSLILFMEAAAEGSPGISPILADPTLPPLGFNSAAAAATDRPMLIAYMVTHGQLRAAPCMERAVLLARDLLAARGHRLVLWNSPPSLADFPILETYARSVWSDAGSYMSSVVKHDVVSASIANFAPILGLPVRLRGCLSECFRLLGYKDNALGLRCLGGIDSVYELWRFSQRLHDARARFIRGWQEQGFDALLCPANATPAPPLDDPTVTTLCIAYNVLFNLFNMPAGVLPVTKVTQADIDALTRTAAVAANQQGWEPNLVALQAGSLNLPVGVQCSALPWRDEACLRLMRELQDSLRERGRDAL